MGYGCTMDCIGSVFKSIRTHCLWMLEIVIGLKSSVRSGGSRGDRGTYPPTRLFGSMSVDVFILISLLATIILNSKSNFDLLQINKWLLLINFLLPCCEICTMYVRIYSSDRCSTNLCFLTRKIDNFARKSPNFGTFVIKNILNSQNFPRCKYARWWLS